MYIDLSGEWKVSLQTKGEEKLGKITLPGILQAQGYGNPIGIDTPWVSSLHDAFWYEQEEFRFAQEDGVNVPFLAQPPAHFTGEAYYQREFTVEEASDEEWYFHAELTKWRSRVWIDGEEKGTDLSLCAPHVIGLGRLSAGRHRILVCIDNSMQLPYRPDSHTVSDALGASWNGMAGEIALYSESVKEARREEKKRYAAACPRTVEVRDGKFIIDGRPAYFRATHFGGENPLTGYPSVEESWWRDKMRVMKEFGLNGIRFHSWCPPEAAFAAADQEDMYLLVECGMWNCFEEDGDGAQMRDALRAETRKILRAFGHHPSFVFFSSGNEPAGEWYRPLREWVAETRAYDGELGYGGRRIYTAQSGWFYDVEPARITGTDFLYFHRSACGPLPGGIIRNSLGWRGKDYGPSLEGCRLPVVTHELGQWCSYPDFSVIDKFKGYLRPGNYQVFRESARAAGLLAENAFLAECSAAHQLRLYKEDIEATFRTPAVQGFELLDLHDYLGQGTALVGLLDVFWEKKRGVRPEDFRRFCGETVLLARCRSYVWKNTDSAVIPLEVCHYGRNSVRDAELAWQLTDGEAVYQSGSLRCGEIPAGQNTALGEITLCFAPIERNSRCTLCVRLTADGLGEPVMNTWPIHVFAEREQEISDAVCYTRDWAAAKEALQRGGRVVFSPHLSELNYECPALSIKNAFWNSQLGPTWCRSLGLAVKAGHPIFRAFPTEASGGWQWEDILRHGRGFHMKGLEGAEVIVRAIDDWNRSLPLGLVWEAKVGGGSLLAVSADLEGGFEARPAADALKKALLDYAASERFAPKAGVTAEAVEDALFPSLRMRQLSADVSFDGDAQVRDGVSVLDPNPNSYVRVERQDFPVRITLRLKRETEAAGLLYVPVQRDRAHEGFVREYEISWFDREKGRWEPAARGMLPNTCRSCRIPFEKAVRTDRIRFTALSAYGCVEKQVWQIGKQGWTRQWQEKRAVVQIACLHLLCGEKAPVSDELFWEKGQKSTTKEIEA